MAISPVADAYSKSLTAGMLQLNEMSTMAQAAAKVVPGSAETFQQFLASAIGQTVELQKASEKKTEGFLSGKVDNVHEVMIAEEKAEIAFQLTMSVRNKIVEAYQEVMRMQI
ncbi:MAG: flagellar hook-basal body complex protein FliE [candidate division FCPU426 bacterium]